MATKPPRKRTLHEQARNSRKNRGLLKDVVVKVHKVPEEVKNMVFQHDRSQKPALSISTPSTPSRKRKPPHESDSKQHAPASKKRKADNTTSTSSPPRKRKAGPEPQDVDKEPASKKPKTANTDTETSTEQQPTKSPYLLKDDGTRRTCFLDLPAELRNEICGQAMSERLNINQRQTWGNEHPLQRTCKQIRAESNLLFHNVTKFQTNKLKHAWKFLYSRTKEQKRSLSSLRISIPTTARAGEHTLHKVRRTLHNFKRTLHRQGVKDSVVQFQLPVYDPDSDKTESHWVSVKEMHLYETMNGRHRNAQGRWERIQVTVLRPTDEQS
ncbi:hypothetical protein PRZ48_014646 [Zasmidium cellare]|uniref:Uncharacterized protein n=1 Tax=Zasmidium cellare TaxID=395010 RepID=A0ABR0DZD7_ZASCE|nr:hypothetical protein PRZ48_014646 [Zasmidium cellare]